MNMKLLSVSPPARTILNLMMFATKALLKVENEEDPLTWSSSGKWRHFCRDLQLTRLSLGHSDEVPLINLHQNVQHLLVNGSPILSCQEPTTYPTSYMSLCRFSETYECCNPLINKVEAAYHISVTLIIKYNYNHSLKLEFWRTRNFLLLCIWPVIIFYKKLKDVSMQIIV